MKSIMTLTDEVNVGTVEDLDGVKGKLNDLITKAANFDITGKVDFLKIEMLSEPDEYQCTHEIHMGQPRHSPRCEQQKKPGRTYAKLILKVSTSE